MAFKFGGAVTAYVHWIGIEMTRGQAGGGGYDRQSAAVAKAAEKAIAAHQNDEPRPTVPEDFARATFFRTVSKDGGETWLRSLENAGFVVIQAV